MATPLSADRFLAALRAEGVKVTERPGWRTHNRNHMGPWGGVNGVVIHHTAGSNSLSVCINGVTGLPGPLCHTHLAKNGTATLVGYGRVNHAGTFAANAHQAVVDESSVHPRPDAAEPVDGNAHYYGIEIENLGSGNDPYPDVQYDQAVRWAAAICRAHGWSANSVIGHKEGTRRKIDPSFSMVTFRTDVDTRLKHPAGWSPGTTPSKEDDMPLSADDLEKVRKAVWESDKAAAPADAPDVKTNPTWQYQSFLKDTNARVRSLEKKLAALSETNGKLVTTVAALAANIGDLDPAAIVNELKAAIESIDIRIDADGA